MAEPAFSHRRSDGFRDDRLLVEGHRQGPDRLTADDEPVVLRGFSRVRGICGVRSVDALNFTLRTPRFFTRPLDSASSSGHSTSLLRGRRRALTVFGEGEHNRLAFCRRTVGTFPDEHRAVARGNRNEGCDSHAGRGRAARHHADLVAERVSDEQISGSVHRDGTGTGQRRCRRRAAVASRTEGASAGDRGDDAGRQVDLADRVVIAIGNVQDRSGTVQREPVRCGRAWRMWLDHCRRCNRRSGACPRSW